MDSAEESSFVMDGHAAIKKKKKKSQIKGKQLDIWMAEVIDHNLFQFNIVPQARRIAIPLLWGQVTVKI